MVSPVFLEAGAFAVHDVGARRVQFVNFPSTLGQGVHLPEMAAFLPIVPRAMLTLFLSRPASCVKAAGGKLAL